MSAFWHEWHGFFVSMIVSGIVSFSVIVVPAKVSEWRENRCRRRVAPAWDRAPTESFGKLCVIDHEGDLVCRHCQSWYQGGHFAGCKYNADFLTDIRTQSVEEFSKWFERSRQL